MSVDTSSAREEIFASIRRNLQASAAHEHEHAHHAPAAPVAIEPANDNSSLTERFVENLEAVRGEWAIVSNAEEAAQVLQDIIGRIKPSRIAVSDSPLVRNLIDQIKPGAEILERAAAAELFNCDVGITGAQLAIAETGTLVLRLESEFSRLTSLVPEVHICILEASRIRANMSEVLDEIAPELDPVVTFITGPSRTSDIELTLAIGVHGPRELFVIVIE
jgi:L-lactate dehydrogenase complex protein LldG